MKREGKLDPKLIARMTPEELGRMLREMRRKSGLRQHEVAARAGVHPSQLSHLEAGRKDLRRMGSKALLSLLKAYGIDEATALDVIRHWGEASGPRAKEAPAPEPKGDGPGPRVIGVPVVEEGMEASPEEASETLPLYLPDLEEGAADQVFGVRMRGDSMEPMLYPGDIALVWTGGDHGLGSMVALSIPGRGIRIGQVYHGPKGEALMHSLNPRFGDEPLPEGTKIWGPVVLVLRSLPVEGPGGSSR